MARPTKLTPETIKAVVVPIRAGNYLETAAAFAGVSKRTLHGWMKDARTIYAELEKGTKKLSKLSAKDKLLVEFLHAVEVALAESEVRDLSTIGNAATGAQTIEDGKVVSQKPGDWRAAAWRLERKFPKKFGLVQRQEHTGVDGGPIEVDDLRGLTNEQLRERLRIIDGEEEES